MTAFSVKRVDSSLEKRIITGMIVSKDYLQEISSFIDLAYFQNSFAKTVATWCLEFYEQYQKEPFENIQNIYEARLQSLKDEEVEIISKLLSDISERYEHSQGINVDYLLDQTVQYFKRRELDIVANNIKFLLDKDKIGEAELQIAGFKKPSRLPVVWSNPFDQESVDEVFDDRESDRFFRFPGELGKFIGNIEREWFIAVTGPFKRGKTWMLQEIAITAMLSGLRVAFFSLEMQARRMNRRIYQRLTAAGNGAGKFVYPCFDCLSNQDGSCSLTDRQSEIQLFNERGAKPEFDPNSRYIPCTSCRGNDSNRFIVDYWFEEIERPSFDPAYVTRQMRAFQKQYKHSLRVISYPRFSANTDDITRDLNLLEKKDDFVPDVILVDYADILRPESGDSATGIDQVDTTWKCLARLAGERHALVVTAAQATREALEAAQVKQKHTSLWIGKLAHVDLMLSLNQTPKEKDDGIMRIGIMAHRHEDFNENACCYVLQNLSLGQVHLDSQIDRGTR